MLLAQEEANITKVCVCVPGGVGLCVCACTCVHVSACSFVHVLCSCGWVGHLLTVSADDGMLWRGNTAADTPPPPTPPPPSHTYLLCFAEEEATAAASGLDQEGVGEEQQAALPQHVPSPPSSADWSPLHTFFGISCATSAAESALWARELLQSHLYIRYVAVCPH
jgi:hypothetical protein